jgi:Secretion system C-terminal sorting domain
MIESLNKRRKSKNSSEKPNSIKLNFHILKNGVTCNRIMKKLFLIAALLFPLTQLQGQSLSPFVYSPAGDFYSNSSAQATLSFTVAELSMVETFSASGLMLTQGFQQPFQSLTVLEAPFVEEFILFPNPANDHLNLKCRLSESGIISLEILSLNGAQLGIQEMLQYSSGELIHLFSIDHLSDGMYVLRVSFENSGTGNTVTEFHRFTIIKN